MNQLCCARISKLIFAALLVAATGCSKLAKVREVQQEVAIDRRGEVVVMPLTATSSLCDVKFDEGELEGSRDYFRTIVRENLVHSFKGQITVVHPKAVDTFIRKQGLKEDHHFDKRSAMKLARLMDAEIVIFGHVKVDPFFKNSFLEKTKRYDLDLEVFVFDITNDDRIATLRCAGKRKRVIKTIPWLVSQLNFYPPIKPPPKPVPKRPKDEKPKKEDKKAPKKG